MRHFNGKILAVVAGLWLLLGAITVANSQPAPTQPDTMSATTTTMDSSMAAKPMTPTAMSAVSMAAPNKEAMAKAKEAEKPAMKAQSGPDSKGSVVGGWAIELVLYLLGAAITAITPVLTSWLWRKYKLDKYMEKKTVDEIVLKGAHFGIGKAEEAAYKLRDKPMKSAEKLDLAIKKANEYIRDSGVVEKGSEYLADLIEAELGKQRPASEKTNKKSESTDDSKSDEGDDTKKGKDR